MTMIIVEE